MTFRQDIVDQFASFRPSAQFVSILGYRNSKGELSNHQVLFRVSYENCVQKSLVQLKAIDLEAIELKGFTLDDLKKTKDELVASFNNTLTAGPGNNKNYTNKDTYEPVYDSEGNAVKGLKLHSEDDVVHITGVFRIHKTVLEAGEYKKVNSRPKTLAKKALQKHLDVSKWGQYKLTPDNFDKIKIDSHEVEW